MTQPTDPNLEAAATQIFNGVPIPPLPPLANPQATSPPPPPPRQSTTPPTVVTKPPASVPKPASPVSPPVQPISSPVMKNNEIFAKLEAVGMAFSLAAIPTIATIFLCLKEIIFWIDALKWGLFVSAGLIAYCLWNDSKAKPVLWTAAWIMLAGPVLAYCHWNGQFLPKVG